MKCPLNANRRIRKPLSIGFVALLILSFVLVTFPHVRAEHPAQTIWIEPAFHVANMYENFTADVKINATNLAGYQFKLFWNRTLLNVTATSYTVPDPSWTNPFWVPLPPTKPLNNEYNATHGLFWLGCANLPPVAISGDYTLATLTFEVMDTGSCSLDLYETELTDNTGELIDHNIVDGYFTTEPHPIALFTYDPPSPLVNEAVAFDASDSFDPDGTIVSYDWDFGDATTDTGMIVTHNYTASGAYNVTLTVADNASLTDTTWHIVMVGGFPEAEFTYSPTIPSINDTVTFDASDSFDPDGTIVSYDWDFGDATTDTGMIVTHNYTASGAYNVTLTVTDNASLTDTTWHIVMVDPPLAMFVFSPTKPLVNQVVTFNASISYDRDGGNITQYSWNFGDGNVTVIGDDEPVTPIITHVYIASKEYKITLTVTDDEGATGSIEKFVTVEGESPVASFTWSPEEPKVGETVTFNASASFDPDGTIAKYSWNFGDGLEESSIDPIITHSYATAGGYTVTLTVIDNKKLEKTATQSITIAKTSSSINITASETTIDVGEDTTISGYITPAREDVNVTIHYRLTGDTTWNTTTDTTNSTGGYSYVWTPDEAGTYEVKASWQGDVNTLGAESSIITVTVEKAAAPDYLVYGLIAIVIIIVAALAVYFLKIRK